MDSNIDAYIKSLSPKEYKAYLIAKDHLGSSFSIAKSVGYLAYKKKMASGESTL